MSSISEDDDLRDASLRRALEHAPDHNAVPDWRMRKSILQSAHDAIVPPLEAGSADVARPCCQRPLGLRGGGRMPWNAAFATVLVATLVTVIWQREQVPGARLDSESSSASGGSAAKAPDAPVTEAAAPSAPPAQAPSTDMAPAAPSSPSEPETTPPVAAVRPESSSPSPSPSPNPSPSPSLSPNLGPVPGLSPPSSASREALARPETPPVEGRLPDFLRDVQELPPLPAPPPQERRRNARESANATAGLGDRLEAKREARPAPTPSSPESFQPSPSPSRSQPPVALPVPAPSAAMPPMAKAAPAAPSPNAVGSVGAPAAAATDRAAAQGPRTEATEPPKFTALSQWNRLTITPRGGTSVSLARQETTELNALLGSAAISAVSPRPFVGGAEFRVMLERNGEALAVFEVGQGQVRWREVGAPPATGAPTPAALAALREALKHAIQPPETRAPAAPDAGLVFAPQPVLPPAESAPPIVAPSDVPSEAPRPP